jgi:hypothetical protein
MSSLADGLPSRFPIGTRYVVEGRGGEQGRLRIRLRYLEFPDTRRPAGRSVTPDARASPAPSAARQGSKIISGIGTARKPER